MSVYSLPDQQTPHREVLHQQVPVNTDSMIHEPNDSVFLYIRQFMHNNKFTE